MLPFLFAIWLVTKYEIFEMQHLVSLVCYIFFLKDAHIPASFFERCPYFCLLFWKIFISVIPCYYRVSSLLVLHSMHSLIFDIWYWLVQLLAFFLKIVITCSETFNFCISLCFSLLQCSCERFRVHSSARIISRPRLFLFWCLELWPMNVLNQEALIEC